MILNVHSDASYLSGAKGRSREGGYFFLGSLPTNGKAIQLGAILLALSNIAPQQANPNEKITKKVRQLVDYVAIHLKQKYDFVHQIWY